MKIFCAHTLAFWAMLGLLWPGLCPADLQPLANADLASISGAGGLSIGIEELSLFVHTGAFSYTDTDTGNALTLEDLTITNGDLRPATFAAGDRDVNGDGLISPLTFDITTITDPASPVYGKALVLLEALDWFQEVGLHVETLRFCGEDLGSLDIGVIHRPSFYWMLGAHEGGGIDWEYGTRLSIDTLRLTYNELNDSLAANGIHFGLHDAGDPADPATWLMTGLFQIGAIAEGNPATFDVGQGEDGMVAVTLNMPMRGSLRVESLQWGGTDFGPLAIDDIQVHRLTVRLIP
ncbi:MAG: hypothetical protein HY911_00410 [Desulfobacterales bacterium]|nr:hypothetical protein [Desulfobacterales bacterium]